MDDSRQTIKNSPLVTGVSSHRNQKLAKLNSKIVLVRLELPANLLCSRGHQIPGELLQPLGNLLVLGENGAKAGQRR